MAYLEHAFFVLFFSARKCQDYSGDSKRHLTITKTKKPKEVEVEKRSYYHRNTSEG